MKKPFLLFTLKAAVILYFAACTSIDHYAISRSATPVVTQGVWKINLYSDDDKYQTTFFAGYTFTFNSSGIVKANKNGVEINGNWFEDNISNRLTIDLGSTDPFLAKLNTNWYINEITKGQVNLQNNSNTTTNKLNITIL